MRGLNIRAPIRTPNPINTRAIKGQYPIPNTGNEYHKYGEDSQRLGVSQPICVYMYVCFIRCSCVHTTCTFTPQVSIQSYVKRKEKARETVTNHLRRSLFSRQLQRARTRFSSPWSVCARASPRLVCVALGACQRCMSAQSASPAWESPSAGARNDCHPSRAAAALRACRWKGETRPRDIRGTLWGHRMGRPPLLPSGVSAT